MEHLGVVPDIITVGRGVTSGYAPISGLVLPEELHQEQYEKTEGNFWHGYTYSGHPTAAAVAMKNLEIIKEENLMDNVNEMGQIMLEGFKWIKEQHSQVS